MAEEISNSGKFNASLEDILKSTELYTSLFTHNPDVVMIFDMKGNFIKGNQSLAKMADTPLEELYGRTYEQFVAPEDLKRVNQHFIKATEGEIQSYECNIITPKGNNHILNVTNIPIIIGGEIVGIYGIAKDVTLLRHIEQQQKNETEMMKSVFDNAHHAVFVTLTVGRILDVNKMGVEMFGYSHEQFLRMNMHELFRNSEDKIKTFNDQLHKTGKAKGVINAERSNGEIFPVEFSSTLVESNESESQCITLLSDITYRKEAEEKLRQSQRRFQALIENSEDIIFLNDHDGKIIYTSPAVEKVMGYTLQELKEKYGYEMIHPDDYEEFKKLIPEMVNSRGTPIPLALRYLAKDGEPLWLEGTITNLLHDKDVQAFVSNYRNITERKKAECELKDSEEKYRMIFNFSPLPMWIYDRNNLKVLEVNEAAVKHYGYNQEEFLNLTVADIRPSSDVDALKKVNILDKSDKFQDLGQWKHIKKNGQLIDVEIKAANIIYQNKSARMIIANDVTEQKVYESKLKNLNAQLKYRAEQLSATNAELEQFAYIASHDLKEPLRMVTSFLQILQKKYSSQLDDNANNYINYAVDGSERMKQLILDLLRYSRTGREESPRETVDMNQLVEEVKLNLLKQIEENNASIEVEALLPRMEVYRPEMLRLLQNLLSNAIKFRRKNVDPVIKINFNTNKTHWIISIADNGIGIPPEHNEKIFNVFSRLHTRQEYPGTGIGLAICKKIVKLHDGDIWVESNSGKGSIFYFSIAKALKIS